MRLEKISTYRFIRGLQVGIPCLVLALIAIPSWNYWSRRTPTPAPEATKELPKDLAVRTDGFSFSRTEGGRTLFTVRARTELGFTDNSHMLENVEVVVYGETDTDPPRRVRSLHANYDQQTEGFRFLDNVEFEFDEKTRGRTNELTYNHRDRIIASSQRTSIEQPGSMTAEANQFEYALGTGLLNLVGDVKVSTTEGTKLETDSAVFDQKANRVTAAKGVVLESTNGVVRGTTAMADLEPGTFKPRTVVVEGSVTAESRGNNAADAWKLQADWLRTLISSTGNAEHVNARGNVEVVKSAAGEPQSLTGGEVDATLDASGSVAMLDARVEPRMIIGSDRTLRANRIWRNSSGGISTEGDSVLEMGNLRIQGRQFVMQQGDIVTFSTSSRAMLQSGERRTSADRTEARFDSRTNTLVDLVQTGNFEFKEKELTGRAQNARVEDSGTIITLEGLPSLSDSQMRIEASQIRLNQKNNSVVAVNNVKTTTKSGGEHILVTAQRAERSGDTVVYTGGVQLFRGAVYIKTQNLQASSKDNSLHAEGSVESMVDTLHAWSDRLDYDDRQRIAHYTGKVRAQKQKVTLETADMTVKVRDNEVSDIVARGKVVLIQGNQRGKGDEAIYDATTGIVTLTGTDAEVEDEVQGLVRGPRLVVNTSGDKMAVLSEGRTRTTTKYKVGK